MAIFQLIEKYLAILGMKSYQTVFNKQNLMIICMLATASISSILYLFEELNFEEYIISVYVTSTVIINTVEFVIMIWRTTKIFEFMKSLRENIQKSE